MARRGREVATGATLGQRHGVCLQWDGVSHPLGRMAANAIGAVPMNDEQTDHAATENSGETAGRKNLRPFKPGQSGNPGGRPKNTLLRRVRELLTPEELD